MKFTPTGPGLVGKPHPLTTDLAPSICPECPWRPKMVAGFSTAMPADSSMLLAAIYHKVKDFDNNLLDGSQGCHMRLELRCRGAEHFRANIGLPSEVTPSNSIMSSEKEAINIWNERMGRKYLTSLMDEMGR